MRYTLLTGLILIAALPASAGTTPAAATPPTTVAPPVSPATTSPAKPTTAKPPQSTSQDIKPTAMPVLKRAWGEQSKGFAISLTTDKATFAIHEKIPLHVACTRSTDKWTVTGLVFVPLCAATIEIRDAKGTLVTTLTKSVVEGGPSQDRKVEKGLIVSEEIVIPPDGTQSYFTTSFARQSGTYSFSAKWHAHSKEASGVVETDVHSLPVTLQIVAD